MTAADQIAEINAQYAERVKLLERERDAKVAIVRGRCDHKFPLSLWVNECIHCGERKQFPQMKALTINDEAIQKAAEIVKSWPEWKRNYRLTKHCGCEPLSNT